MRIVVLIVTVLLLASPDVMASTGGGSLPWETPLQTIADSLSGPVAYAVSLIVFATQLLSQLFQVTGAVLA
jgi:type IV secretion system protein VirB2